MSVGPLVAAAAAGGGTYTGAGAGRNANSGRSSTSAVSEEGLWMPPKGEKGLTGRDLALHLKDASGYDLDLDSSLVQPSLRLMPGRGVIEYKHSTDAQSPPPPPPPREFVHDMHSTDVEFPLPTRGSLRTSTLLTLHQRMEPASRYAHSPSRQVMLRCQSSGHFQ
jgi:hypothetical protein